MTFISQNIPQARLLEPVAVLVDGENLSAAHAGNLLQIARQYGVPRVRRVYGKAEHIVGWEQDGYRLVPCRFGKNSADLLLCVEAMSLGLREQFRTILICSSDRDFTYLAEHLRELGHQIVGIGEAKAPASFRKACSDFIALVTDPGSVPAALKPVVRALTLDERLFAAIGKQGIEMSQLNLVMRGQTVLAQTGHKSWRAYLKTKPALYAWVGTKLVRAMAVVPEKACTAPV